MTRLKLLAIGLSLGIAATLGLSSIGVAQNVSSSAKLYASATAATSSQKQEPVGEAVGPHWPREASAIPTQDEWKNAITVKPARVDHLARACRFSRVKEWLKIHCPKLHTSAISVLGGSDKDVHMWIAPVHELEGTKPGADIIFPVRPGDRRLIQVLEFGEAYAGPGHPVLSFTISEQWIDGEAAPIVVAY